MEVYCLCYFPFNRHSFFHKIVFFTTVFLSVLIAPSLLNLHVGVFILLLVVLLLLLHLIFFTRNNEENQLLFVTAQSFPIIILPFFDVHTEYNALTRTAKKANVIRHRLFTAKNEMQHLTFCTKKSML